MPGMCSSFYVTIVTMRKAGKETKCWLLQPTCSLHYWGDCYFPNPQVNVIVREVMCLPDPLEEPAAACLVAGPAGLGHLNRFRVCPLVLNVLDDCSV